MGDDMPQPERSISSQTYNGIAITCAMMYCPEVTRFRLKNACPMTENYYFEGVMRSTTNQTITLILGNKSEDIEITDTFQKYTKFFPDVDVSDDTDAYIVLPVGTYFFWNIQIEVATSPSAWRPAPEDAEDYANMVAKYAVDNQTQLDIFNKLTANGTAQGIYLVNGQLYINGAYIAANTVSADVLNGGTITGVTIDIGNGTFTVDENGQVIAANLHIIGGEINIDTQESGTPWQIYLRNTYNSRERTVAITPTGIAYHEKSTNTDITNSTFVQGDTVTLLRNSGGVKYVAQIENVTGFGRVTLYGDNGNKRAQLSTSGLTFYASDGTTVTKTYSAT